MKAAKVFLLFQMNSRSVQFQVENCQNPKEILDIPNRRNVVSVRFFLLRFRLKLALPCVCTIRKRETLSIPPRPLAISFVTVQNFHSDPNPRNGDRPFPFQMSALPRKWKCCRPRGSPFHFLTIYRASQRPS